MLKNGDFIKLEYEGYDEKNQVFDSTKGEIGKTLHGKDGPILVVVGHYKLIKGLDETVRTMVKGEEKEAKFGPDKAFGSRNKNMVKVLSLMDFRESEVYPEVGTTIHLDTEEGRLYGVIKSVSGGRVLVDFNHPLADRNVKYKVKLIDVIESTEEKLKILMAELELTGTMRLTDNEVIFTLNKKGEDYELKKVTLLAMAKNFIPELKKVDAKESA